MQCFVDADSKSFSDDRLQYLNKEVNMKQKNSTGLYKGIGRTAAIAGGVLLVLLILAYGVMWVLVNGPSPTAKRLFVLSVKETSAGGFLANIYLSDEEINDILLADKNQNMDETFDKTLITIPDAPDRSDEGDGESDVTGDIPGSESGDESTKDPATEDGNGVEVVDVVGTTYNGKLLIIKDPSRVFVGVLDSYGPNSYGITVKQMIEKYDALAGTNAGGFYDPNGQGTGGIPDGIVISEYNLMWGDLNTYYSIAGLDGDGILHVGLMTGQQALDAGIKYAASYGPALVVNGKHAGGAYGLGGGLNPRTAIGQRADGAILLMVINGRSLGSLGATLDDLAEIMLSYGAVNATNLDGGSSSIMIMEGEYLTSSSYIFGERMVANAILVKK